MPSILVATDLSERSERAVRRAFAIAGEQGARLSVLAVIDSDLPEDISEDLVARYRQRVERFCASVSDHPAQVLIEIDDPLDAIHATADKLEADLIVLGVHRPRPVLDMFSGTTMERLVRASQRPVLLVRDPVDHAYERILCGLDLTEICLSAAALAASIAPQGRVTTFHAVNIPFRGFLAPGDNAAAMQPFIADARAKLSDWLARIDLPARVQSPDVIGLAPADALHAQITKHRPHLVALGAHSRPAFSPNYLGSLTESLMRNPPCDLLVARG